MNRPIHSTIHALCNRQRLMLAFVLTLLSGIGLSVFSLTASVDMGGWSSGFSHPLHGGDHLLTMLAVGIWAAQMRGKAIWMLPVTFVGVMSLGGLAGAAGLLIPGAEAIILLSCLVFAVLVTRKIRFSSRINITIVAFFAFFHGYAHGQEISTSVSLISYTFGFMVATLLLHGTGILVVRLCLLVFVFFLSHMAFVQASAITSAAFKPVLSTQTDNTLTFRSIVPENNHYRHMLHSGEDANNDATTIKQQTLNKPLTNRWHEPECAINEADKAQTDELATLNPPILHLLGIQFLSGGVGVTSPPAELIVDDTHFFCSATVFFAPTQFDNTSSSLETTCYFDLLPSFFTLATSLLTNGVGTTSPPESRESAVVSPFSSNELANGNSIRFLSSNALHPASSRTFLLFKQYTDHPDAILLTSDSISCCLAFSNRPTHLVNPLHKPHTRHFIIIIKV